MKIAKTAQVFISCENWLQLPQGEMLQKQIQFYMEKYLPQCFGYHLLKLGALSCALDTSLSPIKHQINCTTNGENIGVLADIHELPFQDSSVDLCILTHELNFSNDPHQLLREIDRVLTLDGTLIISGYNPLSVFGLHSLLNPKLRKATHLFLPERVIDWLSLLGFDVKKKVGFGLFSCEEKSFASPSLERLAQLYVPYFCSNYLIFAKKTTKFFTPIKSPFIFKKPIRHRQPIATRHH